MHDLAKMYRSRLIQQAADEFRAQCAEIDRKAEEAQQKSLQEAYAALLAGDTAKRDRICQAAMELPEKARAAKLEIGLRIGERLGLDRDGVEEAVRRIWATN